MADVFVVEQGEYSGRLVAAAFSTLEKAIAYIPEEARPRLSSSGPDSTGTIGNGSGGTWDITKFTLDPSE